MREKKKMNSLKSLKDALYCGEKALLYNRTKISETDFLALYFSDDFYKKSFADEKGNGISVSAQLWDSSQRNKVFNRSYSGYAFKDNLQRIFLSHPEVWTALCTNCRRELDKTEQKEHLRDYLKELGNEENNKKFSELMQPRIEAYTHEALAITIVYFLLQGDLENMDRIIQSSKSYISHFSYLNKTVYQLKHTFDIKEIELDARRVLDKYYDSYARLLKYVASVSSEETEENRHLLDDLYGDLKAVPTGKAIRIFGASGADKNSITQLLYLKLIEEILSGSNIEDAPLYINFNLYNNSNFDSFDGAVEAMKHDVTPFVEFCKNNPERKPVVFVDGIRRFPIDSFQVDYEFKKLIDQLKRKKNVKYVVSVEEGPSGNEMREKTPPAFATGDYYCDVKLNPMYIPDSVNSKKYLEIFDEIYGDGKHRDIYSQLKRLRINYVDTHQLRMFTKNEKLWEVKDIAELYDAVCSDQLNGDTHEMSIAEEWAFNFAYTDKELIAMSNPMKRLLSAHDTILEFFIAKWYLSQIRSETLQIDVINMVMPKGVTRFIVPMLNRSAANEDRVLRLIEENYERMDLMAQSEMTYWLGRMKFASKRADQLLATYYEEQKKHVEEIPVDSEEYKNALFILRGIAVSLIVKGHKDVSDEYISSLISNKLANEINRGFHLEYYGDKPYYPVYDTLNFIDDITAGKNTLDQLITANEISMENRDLPPVFEINLFTICSLLQARIESSHSETSFDIAPYVKTAVQHVNWYLENANDMMPVLREFFHMIHQDFTIWLEEPDKCNSVAARSYMVYSKRLPRTGWVDLGIPCPETTAEHMYSCWLMGMMFLPDVYDGYEDYSKDKILKLLLIHDAAEAVTGDIPRPVKKQDPQKYDKEEEKEMGIFLLRRSYPSIQSDMEAYYVWKEWNDSNSINGRIAREIDTIQAMYQLLIYLNENPERFEDKDMVVRWLNESKEVITKPGREILEKLITGNYAFKSILKEYHG